MRDFETHSRRVLAASATGSTVSGDGVADMQPYTNYTVTVAAKDSGGTLLGTGDDLFFVRIQNECTISNQTTCTDVGGAANTMPTPLEALMTYNGDSTYSYNYTLNVTGKVSLLVILRNEGIVHGEYWSNSAFTGASSFSNTTTDIDFFWGPGVSIFSTHDTSVSAKYSSYIRPSVTDT